MPCPANMIDLAIVKNSGCTVAQGSCINGDKQSKMNLATRNW
jgi:hypothetical protein